MRPQRLLHVRVQQAHRVLVVKAPRHPGLVGDQEGEQVAVVGRLDRGDGVFGPLEVFRPMDIAVVDIQHPVAIEEDRRAAQAFGDQGLGRVQGVGYANIEEEALLPTPGHLALGRQGR